MNFVPCVKWVKSGVAKSNPVKIKLSPEELKQLIAEEKQKEIDEDEDEASDEETKSGDNDEVGYNMKNYDKDDNQTLRGAMGLGSVAVLEDDSNSSQHKIKLDDSDSEIDNEIIRQDDNLLLVGHVQDEMSILEVYLYNEKTKDFYVHHDILLPSVPLCFEWLGYDPQNIEPGNLVAIGDMGPIIKIWDLDIIDCLKPAFTLGKKKKLPKEGYKHNDAILDIAWNTNAHHILASGSVDETILLWDLDECVATTQMSHSTGKIQMLKWHPQESHTLLTGSSDSRVRIYDCRTYNSYLKWKLDGEIEKGIWNNKCPFSCIVGTSTGYVYNIDVRNKKPLWKIQAFEKEITGLYIREDVSNDKLYVCSNEEKIKVYNELPSEPKLIKQKQINIGEIMCLEANPNHTNIIALGGTKRCKNITVLDIETVFDNNELVDNSDQEEEEDSDVDDLEGFFGLKNDEEKKKANMKKINENVVEFVPTPFSHLDATFVRNPDKNSMTNRRKKIKKEKKKVKTMDKMKKKKKQEKMQKYQEKVRQQRR